MTEPQRPTAVRPFRALRFDPARVDVPRAVSPPYDVISEVERTVLAAAEPHNVVRLILPEPGREDEAGRLLEAWRRDGVVVQEPEPCLYAVEQDYRGPDGVARTRSGFLAIVRLEPYEAGVVRPHERTHAAPKEGRLRLLRATEAQLSPVFALYRDPEGTAERALREHRGEEVDLEATDRDGTIHRFWRVESPAAHEAVRAAVERSPLLIADGHHRYETALAYGRERDARGDDPAAWTMMYLASADSEGLSIFPTHRVVAGVDGATFVRLPELLSDAGLAVAEFPGDVSALEDALATVADDVPAFAIWRGGDDPPLLCRLEDPEAMRAALPAASEAARALDVAVVQALVLDRSLGLPADEVPHTDRLRYAHRASEAAEWAEAPDALAVLLRPPSIAAVEAVAEAGDTMPPKSTYFFPKTIDGVVFYDVRDAGA